MLRISGVSEISDFRNCAPQHVPEPQYTVNIRGLTRTREPRFQGIERNSWALKCLHFKTSRRLRIQIVSVYFSVYFTFTISWPHPSRQASPFQPLPVSAQRLQLPLLKLPPLHSWPRYEPCLSLSQ